MKKTKTLSKKELLKKYDLKTYKANKNCKPVTVNGVVYASKTQCCVLNNITRKELEELLKEPDVTPSDYFEDNE